MSRRNEAEKKEKEGNNMYQKFDRVEKHFYRRQYQTSGGDWSTLYYAIFTDWKKKRRTFPLGSDLKTAKNKLKEVEGRNVMREDFDKDKIQGVTFSKWAERYLELVRHKKSLERDDRSCRRLSAFLGPMLLSEITRAKVMEYRNMRLTDPIIRRGKPVDGSKLKASSVNRELACLKHMLRLAADEGIIENVPTVKLDSEKKFARRRVVSDEEFKALLDASPRYLQRVLIGLYETAMRRDELLKLTWNRVDEGAGVIRLLPEDTKEDDKRIVPITPALQEILSELRAEQKRVANLASRVFTRDGHPITSVRTVFELARERAGVTDMVIHDFRHTAITRWASLGMPQEIAMKASGHKSLAMHYRYVNLQEKHVKEAFKLFTQRLHGIEVDAAKSVSY